MLAKRRRLPALAHLLGLCCAVFLSRPASAARYAVRDDGVILKDGKPFFPNGFFARSQDHARGMKDLQTIMDAGFNTVKVGIFAANDLNEILDAARARNVEVVLEADSRNPSSSTLLPLVARAKAHPAVMGYYVMDDAHVYVSPQQLKKKHDDIKAADPDRLTFMSDYDHTAFGPWLGITDLSGPYRYPVKTATAPLELVNRTYAEARKCNCPLIAIPQAFAWSGNRLPNAKEERNMVYQALANNVKGVLYYTFNGEGYVTDSPELWAECKRLAPEVDVMGEVIMNGQFTYVTTNVAGVVAAFWKVGAEYTVVAINTQPSTTTEVVITLPNDAVGEARALFADRPKGFSWANRSLRGIMQPLDVHVYRIGVAALPPSARDAGNPAETLQDAAAGPSDQRDAGSNVGGAGGNVGGAGGKGEGDDGDGGSEGDEEALPAEDSMQASGCSCDLAGRSPPTQLFVFSAMFIAGCARRVRRRREKNRLTGAEPLNCGGVRRRDRCR